MLFLFFLNARAYQREVIIYFRKITLAHVGTKSTLQYWRRKTIRYFDSVHPLIRRIIYLYCPKGKTFHNPFLNPPTNTNYLNLPPPPSRIKRISYLPPIVKKIFSVPPLPGKFYWNSPNCYTCIIHVFMIMFVDYVWAVLVHTSVMFISFDWLLEPYL